ncbi:shikimate dehydrogenase [Paenactinomyces guangxiensis]|uniref:Shikimate dehydrogenase (NADP(+)) n=1 Tax=Paenactinomyces guangxiensis TaxID=1490290 RepID=A0A7W1WNB5_9BACL|nr:shikimate dehydrogenase [Paenactinomyces guangxiensis]MBA4493075.1 shikimate dehydrogenase [Paenactinomyces guangxiensis]MBH8590075.1 shikimate dehydrogenase [Paenactinomyces guangxiensis]
MITSQTGGLGLLGHPAGHSKSPEMMNAALQMMDAPYVYLAFDVTPAVLKQAVEGLKALKFKGWNVTIPHKTSIMEYLDGVAESAREIGAVNTVVYQDGKWTGHNTDGTGYLRSLKEETSLDLSKQRVVILGAGGAARAVGYALATAGVPKVTIANRTLDKADRLAEHLSRWTSTEAIAISDCQDEVREADLVVNTTSVGMFPRINETPIPADWLHHGQIVSDLVYNPRETALLQAAKLKGAQIHCGLGMLVYQAATALELWLDKPVPIQLMKQVLEASLSGNKK